jgi:hypothetical protein
MSMIEHLESRQLLSVAPLFAHGVPFKAAQLTALSNVTVAGFKEKAVDPIGNYSATISWGDGSSPSAGTIVSDGKGGFLVQGSHTYANPGADKVVVQITDSDGSSAKAFGLVRVTDAPITTTGQDINGVQGLAVNGVVATFVDPDPASTATAPATEIATILWGDGSASVGTIAQTSANNFTVTGKHIYAGAKTFAIKTIVRDRAGAVSIGTSNANIVVPVPTTSPNLIGADFVGTVKAGGGGLFGSIIGKIVGTQSFEWRITGQDLTSLTGTISIAGHNTTQMFTGKLLTNGQFAFSDVISGVTGSLIGFVRQDATAMAGVIKGSFGGFSISGNFLALNKA